MLGMLFGSYFFGWMSDTLGRVNALIMAVITVSLPGFFGYLYFFPPPFSKNPQHSYLELSVEEPGEGWATVY